MASLTNGMTMAGYERLADEDRRREEDEGRAEAHSYMWYR